MDNLTDFLYKYRNLKSVAAADFDHSITYKELFELASCLAQHLESYQISSPQVALIFSNSVEYIVTYFAVLTLGKTVVPLSPKISATELVREFGICRFDAILIKDDYNFPADAAIPTQLIPLSMPKIMQTAEKRTCDPAVFYQSYAKQRSANPVAILLQTSGTTSNPKKVMLGHTGLIKNQSAHAKSVNLTKTDITLICLPVYFGYANTSQMLATLFCKGKVVLINEFFQPKIFFSSIQKFKVTTTTMVPTTLYLLEQFHTRFNADLSSLRSICFGAGFISAQKLSDIISKFPRIDFYQTYGLTEAGPRVTTQSYSAHPHKSNSIGRLLSGVKVQILDHDFKQVPTGVIGQISVKSPSTMLGYYNNLQETEKKYFGQYLLTGDLGYFDKDKFLYLTGRLKNIVISGGINIFPEEIEQVMLESGLIKEIMVSGIPDDLMGEVLSFHIVKDNESTSVEDIREYAASKLSPQKQPKLITFTSELPKTYNGKTKRFK